MSSTNIKSSGFTLAKGKELVGDDFYDIKTIGDLTVAIVCDGVGSAAEGAQAASRVTSYLINNFKMRPKSWSIEKSIITFIKSINSILYKESIIQYERPELVTTLALVVIEGNRLYGANVGDSRIYLYRDKRINQLSQDHVMQEKGYENVLTKAIGIEEEAEPYYFENIIQEDDKILLCSDGLYNIMETSRLESGILFGAHGLVKKASKITQHHLPDDTTAVVLDIIQADEFEILKQQELLIPQSLKKGQDIDGYILERSLIQNDRTWICSKKSKQYVIKFPPLEAVDNEMFLDLFVKEAWNAKRLRSEFFPKAVIPKKRTYRYYIMQFLEGEDLKSHISVKNISIDDAIKLSKMLLDMSQYLLKYDLVHGDIKPENIMVVVNGSELGFQMIDFGSITEIFSTSSRAGTPSYLSPQRFKDEAISETTEIFAIGVTLYMALTKKYPYGEIEPFSNPIFKEAKKPSIYNKNIPAWLDSVVLRAIAIEPERRYQHYSEMMYELQFPQNVKPFFPKNSSIIERSPLLFYRTAFTVMFLLNIILIIYYNLD
ncbi:protein phosphatase 2C domain-containing protein [Sulfurimonas sp. HSL3-2]|uniref:bifunctional protein-serine/threonine kinase/phosphatase n=1 Tax=Hydrocurvibacter mobilis TaxID=3131936 RepID=UPI0031F87572